MARLNDDTFSRGFETARVLLGHPKFSSELAAAIRKEGGTDKAVEALLQAFSLADINPFAISIDETLDRLLRVNREEDWGISEPAIMALAESAPEWPEGRLAFRSLRVRFGEGDAGVALTFERHVARIKQTFDPKYWRWEYLRSDSEHLRLLSGNDTHRPTVEWVTFDLGAHRKRSSVKAVRGPDSLADEGLVFTWMFPQYAQSIDYKERPAFFLAGYELNVPEHVDESWQHVPIVDRDPDSGEVYLRALWHSSDSSVDSVPSARE